MDGDIRGVVGAVNRILKKVLGKFTRPDFVLSNQCLALHNPASAPNLSHIDRAFSSHIQPVSGDRRGWRRQPDSGLFCQYSHASVEWREGTSSAG
jgi:hypothetical protein